MSIWEKVKRNAWWQLYSLLPKDPQKAVCQSFYGRGLSDSPGAIALELRERGWKVCWIVKDMAQADTLPRGITPLLLESREAIYHLCTAGAWVDNCRKWAYTQKRGKTRYVQTWHGFPLKRIEGDAAGALPEEYLRAAEKDSAMADLFVSDSRFLTEVYRRAFWYGGEVLECGFPRNDVLFDNRTDLAGKVRKALQVPEGKRLALYAPTFRKDQGLEVYDMDYARCARALGERFGEEWLLLAKLHPNMAEKAAQLHLDPQTVVNASDYPDIQELYVACDALFTDYSSVMFDYMATGKPCFLYVNDVQAYKDDRNFYFDLDKLPYARAEDNDGLERAILGYEDAAQRQAVARFQAEFGIKEDGRAAAAVADWLEGKRA